MNFEKIKGYEEYEINNEGVIKNKYGKILKPWKTKYGYIRFKLCKNRKSKDFQLHRLVALQFIPNPENKPTVDHINRIRDDNRVINLRWATHKEQQENAIRQPPRKITKGGIREHNGSYEWSYCVNGKRTSKCMKNKEDLIKYRDELLSSLYNNNE